MNKNTTLLKIIYFQLKANKVIDKPLFKNKPWNIICEKYRVIIFNKIDRNYSITINFEGNVEIWKMGRGTKTLDIHHPNLIKNIENGIFQLVGSENEK